MTAALSILERTGSLNDQIEAAQKSELICLNPNQVLFAPGTEKQACFYWIVEGQMKLRWQSPGSSADIVELLGAGNYFGLGFLDHYVCGAVTATDVTLQPISMSAAPRFAEMDLGLRQRITLETHREFDHRRETLTASASKALPQRLAAFLAFISRFNSYEGRDPLIISDDMTCGVVAGYLSTDIETLGRALKQLGDLRAVEIAPPGDLRIRDLDFLEYIAGSEEKLLAQ